MKLIQSNHVYIINKNLPVAVQVAQNIPIIF